MADILPRLKGYMDFTSPENKQGLPLDFTKAERGVNSTFTIPAQMSGWRGKDVVGAHPGAVDTVLHTAMGWAAATHLRMAGLQKSASIEYFDLVPVEAKLRCEARVLRVRHQNEAIVEAQILDENNTVLAKSVGSFVMFALEKLGDASRVFDRLATGACAVAFLQAAQAQKKSE